MRSVPSSGRKVRACLSTAILAVWSLAVSVSTGQVSTETPEAESSDASTGQASTETPEAESSDASTPLNASSIPPAAQLPAPTVLSSPSPRAQPAWQLLRGTIGHSSRWKSAWLSLEEPRDFAEGATIRLQIRGSAESVCIRLLTEWQSPEQKVGIDGVYALTATGPLTVRLTRSYHQVKQISIHGGSSWECGPDGVGPPLLSSIETTEKPGPTEVAIAQPIQFTGSDYRWTPLQVALFPPLQLVSARWSVIGVSFAVVGVRKRDVFGIDLAGIVNLSNDTHGIQIAGGMNMSGDLYGLQLGGVANVASDLGGLQASLFFNRAKGELTGVQIAAVNVSDSSPQGIQLGFANYALGEFRGVQLGYLFNNVILIDPKSGLGLYTSNNHVRGIQVALLANSSNDMAGIQLSELVNTARGMRGVQVSAMNFAGDIHGIQAGILSYAGGMHGIQAGIFSYAGDMRGWQIGGLNLLLEDSVSMQTGVMNFAIELKGLQIGVINFAYSLKGIQIGAINIAPNAAIPVLPVVNASF